MPVQSAPGQPVRCGNLFMAAFAKPHCSVRLGWQCPDWADLDKDFERSESTDGPEMDVPFGRFLGSKA